MTSAEKLKNPEFVEISMLYRSEMQGNPDAICQRGIYYYEGKYVEKNYETALGYFRMAASKGSVRAHYYLGKSYENGHGVKLDIFKAHDCYRYAADGNLKEAKDVFRNKKFRYISKLLEKAEKGNADALAEKGRLLYYGKDVEQNTMLALACLKEAADKNNLDAIKMLCNHYTYEGDRMSAQYYSMKADNISRN